jgi:hypothetical protein
MKLPYRLQIISSTQPITSGEFSRCVTCGRLLARSPGYPKVIYSFEFVGGARCGEQLGFSFLCQAFRVGDSRFRLGWLLLL